jgi:hypothetical protein
MSSTNLGLSLEQPVELARGVLLCVVDQFLYPHESLGARGEGDVRALVVRAVFGNALGARAEACHRHDDFHLEAFLALVDLPDESHFVVHQALDLRDRRGLVDEVRKRHLDVAGLGFQALNHLAQHQLEGFHGDLALVRIQNLDKARHVRALELVRQADVHVERRDGVLHFARALGDADGMADRLDPDLVDGELALVLGTLDVGDGERIADIHEERFVTLGSILEEFNMRPVPGFFNWGAGFPLALK